MSGSDRPRVVVADDHPGVRHRIAETLLSTGFEVVHEAATAVDAVTAALQHRPDLVLLDVHMPGNGIRAARRITTEAPEVTVIMVTQSAEDEDLFDSLRAGAAGYVLKSSDLTELPGVLRGALAGEAAISSQLVNRVLDEFRNPRQRLFARRSPAAAKLSSREWEVMSMLADGRTTEEVAKALYLSSTTVRVHVSTVLRKLAVKDRESAIHLLSNQ